MRNRLLLKYIVSDVCTAAIAWYIFIATVATLSFNTSNFFQISSSSTVAKIIELFIISGSSVLFYAIQGYYKDTSHKSRLTEFAQTLSASVIISIILYFIFTISSTFKEKELLSLMGIFFICTYIPRVIYSSRTAYLVQNGKISFPTLIVGGYEVATNICADIRKQKVSGGNKVVGFVSISDSDSYPMMEHAPYLGGINNIVDIINDNKIKEIIFAIENTEKYYIEGILNDIAFKDVRIKAAPAMQDLLLGKVNMTRIFGAPLIEVKHQLMPQWQKVIKQLMDIILSSLFVLLFSPVYLILAVAVKVSSPGPIFFKHERIGRFGKPFNLYKFRSMTHDAEKNGPQLAVKDDPRITTLGKFLRKTKLDEIPNFFNVIKGDMSLVGPRPERKYFIDKVCEVAPHYKHLLKVKPGITSWGQVNYGYASSIEEIVERLKYDILYIENMTLSVDIKIILYTLITIAKGKGM